MIPDSFVVERKNYQKGEVIFEQDSPAPSFIALESGDVEIYFENITLSLENDRKKIFSQSAPCGLLDSAKLSDYNYHNFTAIAATEVSVVIWDLPVGESVGISFNTDGEAAGFLKYISESVTEQFALLDKVMSLRTILDKTLHLYDKDIKKLLFEFEQKIGLRNEVRLHDSADILRNIKHIHLLIPQVSDFILENVLSDESRKIERLKTLSTQSAALKAGDYFAVDLKKISPAVYILTEGEVELYYSGVVLCHYNADDIIGINTYFYQLDHQVFDYKNIKYKVIADCKLEKCFAGISEMNKKIAEDSRVFKIMFLAIVNKYANLLVYNAFIISRMQNDFELLDSNSSSFLSVLYKTDRLLADTAAFIGYRRKIATRYNNIRNVSKNLRKNFIEQTTL